MATPPSRRSSRRSSGSSTRRSASGRAAPARGSSRRSSSRSSSRRPSEDGTSTRPISRSSARSSQPRSGGSSRRGAPRRSPSEPYLAGDPKWGGLARRAAGRIEEGGSGASSTWREVMDAAREEAERHGPPDRSIDQWVRVDDEVRDEASSAVRRGRRPDPDAHIEIEDEVRTELNRSVGATRAPRLEQRLADATRCFSAERYIDAARILRKLVDEAPRVAAARELYGVTLYRQAKWKLAVKELEAFRLLTGSTEQHPVLADCYRALGDRAMVAELWEELRQASPSAELVVEGRIVAAGSLADNGDLPGAIRLLEQGWRMPRRAQEHHLRRGYALADVYERAGDVARARELFERLAVLDPDFADVRLRARALR